MNNLLGRSLFGLWSHHYITIARLLTDQLKNEATKTSFCFLP
jgi:hypothetical protein